jgi:hypothetical protein
MDAYYPHGLPTTENLAKSFEITSNYKTMQLLLIICKYSHKYKKKYN